MRVFFLDNMGLLNELIRADKWLFHKINSQWTIGFLDNLYPWWRESNTWVPFYVFLLAFMLLNFRKNAWPWVLFALFNVLLSDQISSTFFKHTFMRLRPCADGSLDFPVRLLLDHCSGGFSFTSSHATNHFGFAMFIYKTLGAFVPKWKWPLFLWAASISYGQIYVGVHYPLDVIVGALLGCLLGYAVAGIYNRRMANHYPLTLVEG